MRFPTDYERTVESSFASGPFRVEYRAYPNGGGLWQMLHQCNGAIITTGASPAGCVDNLVRMAEQMRGICSSLPHSGQKGEP